MFTDVNNTLFNFVNTMYKMEIENWYGNHFEDGLSDRYIALEHIDPLLELYKNSYEISVIGQSENGQEIPMIKIGHGEKTVLAWSQMHGNEATTTKGLFDFLKFVTQKQHFQPEVDAFLSNYTLYIIPILNPDGAQLYTRENANKVDLNRDAQDLSQKESQCLRKLFEALKPDLCLNMHDQRSIYGFDNGKPATISFLSPAANKERTVTEARKIAMKLIVKMNNSLQKYIPEQVGRYDDSFNEACVGDTFQKTGTPTILFETGHYKQDYEREKTREFIFYALLSLFNIIEEDYDLNYEAYFDIPENLKNYNDFILRNVKLNGEEKLLDIALQYQEVLNNSKIDYEPMVAEIDNLKSQFGHKEADAKGSGILTNSQENSTIGSYISNIINKSDNSVIYFQKLSRVIS